MVFQNADDTAKKSKARSIRVNIRIKRWIASYVISQSFCSNAYIMASLAGFYLMGLPVCKFFLSRVVLISYFEVFRYFAGSWRTLLTDSGWKHVLLAQNWRQI